MDKKGILKLTEKHIDIMINKDIIIQVYTNASGFLWQLSKIEGGTDLGWSEFNGDCIYTGCFTSYGKALEDAISLIEKCDLEKFKKDVSNFHWGNYANHLNKNYRSVENA